MNLYSALQAALETLFRPTVMCATVIFALASSSARADSNEMIVRVKPSVDVSRLANDVGCVVNDHVEGSDVFTLRGIKGQSQQQLLVLLGHDGRVAYVEPNEKIAPPEVGGGQLHYAFDRTMRPAKYVSQSAYSVINLGFSHLVSTGKGITVAVLDTGVALHHPVMAGRLVPGFNALTPDSAPNDASDGVTNIAAGHGTMVAGIIARIAPGALIMPVRVLNADGIGTTMTVVRGLRFAIDHGARVINLSLGTLQSSSALEDEISRAKDAGAVIIASAGNEGKKLRQFPAAFGDVVAVGSIESTYVKSDYSNYGGHIVVEAPGTSVTSTYYDGGYATWSGTSFAAPMVAGEAALVLSLRPQLKGSKVKEIIEESTLSISRFNLPVLRGMLGRGAINVIAAVRRAAALPLMSL